MLDSPSGSCFALRGAEILALRFVAVPCPNVARHIVRPHPRHVALPSRRRDKFSSWPGLLGSPREVARFDRWRGLCGARDTLSDQSSYDNKPTNITGGAILNERKHVASLPRSSLYKGNTWADARKRVRFDERGEYRVYQDLLEGKKTRFVSRVMYDGTNYHGFQLQGNGRRTIQEILESTLSQRFQTYVPVLGAGRTDTGVHAIGQAVHFDLLDADEDLGQLTYSMNQMMPPDIRVWNMAVAPPSSPSQAERGLPWSAMLNARSKLYSYRLFVGQIPSPLERLYRTHASHAARSTVDVERIQRSIPRFEGEHDFAGFSNEVDKRGALRRAEGFAEFNTRRTVYSAEFVDEGDGNIRLDFHLDGALYRMVRNMVGTLLAIGAGRFEPEVIEEIFRTGVRDSDRIFPAPAHGLTLKTVHYDGYT